MSYPPPNYQPQVAVNTTTTVINTPAGQSFWVGDGNITSEDKSQMLCYDITLMIFEIVCIGLGFAVIGVDWVVNNLCLIWEIYFFWGAISTLLHLIGLFLPSKNEGVQAPQVQLLQSQPTQNNLPQNQQGGEGGGLDGFVSNYLGIGVTGKWKLGKILMFPFYIHANVKHVLIELMIVFGIFACLRLILGYAYEFYPGMFDSSYAKCFNDLSSNSCYSNLSELYISTARGLSGIIILVVGLILDIIVEVLIGMNKVVGIKSLGLNFIYRAQGLGEGLAFIFPIICFLHNFRSWGGPFLHWTFFYNKTIESNGDEWGDGRHVGARGIIAVFFLLLGIVGLIAALGSIVLIFFKFGRNLFKIIHIVYMSYSITMDILMFVNFIFALIGGIMAITDGYVYNHYGEAQPWSFTYYDCNSLDYLYKSSDSEYYQYCIDNGSFYTSSFMTYTGPFALLYLIANFVITLYAAVYYAQAVCKGSHGWHMAKNSFETNCPDEYRAAAGLGGGGPTLVVVTAPGGAPPPPQPQYQPRPGYPPQQPGYPPQQPGYPPQQPGYPPQQPGYPPQQPGYPPQQPGYPPQQPGYPPQQQPGYPPPQQQQFAQPQYKQAPPPPQQQRYPPQGYPPQQGPPGGY